MSFTKRPYIVYALATLLLSASLASARQVEEPIETVGVLASPVNLPGYVDPAASAEDSAILASQPLSVDWALLEIISSAEEMAIAMPVEMQLFEDIAFPVQFEKVESRWSDTDPPVVIGHTLTGTILSPDGSHVILIEEPGMVAANIFVGGIGPFQIRTIEGQVIAREIGEIAAECGVGQNESSPQAFSGGGAESSSSSGCDDGSIIDVVIIYTPAAKDYVFTRFATNINTEIELSVRDGNIALVNSDIPAQFRLLYSGEVNYVESGNFGTDLTALTAVWDGELNEVHPLRNALRADLVQLWVGTGIPDGGIANLMTSLSPTQESRGFGVVWAEGGVAADTLEHEFGHNLGCSHDRDQQECDDCWIECDGCGAPCNMCNNTCDPGIFDYSFGHKLTSGAGTVMSYFATRLPHFSNPSVLYMGEPTGVPESNFCHSADNASTITVTRDTLVQFRVSHDQSDTTTRASEDYFVGQAANGDSLSVNISENGQYIVFASNADNFDPADNNVMSDVFFGNRESGVVQLISGRKNTFVGDNASHSPTISGDGRYISFASDATNLGVFDGNGATDIYARTQTFPQMIRISLDTNNNEADGDSFSPTSSFTGRYVAFASEAENLDPADDNDLRDIFLRDRDVSDDGTFEQSGDVQTDRVSEAWDAPLNEPNGPSFAPSISSDGLWIAFESDASNLLPPGIDLNNKRDIFVVNRTTLNTTRVSITSTGGELNGDSFDCSISGDGRFVTFAGEAANGVPGDTNNRIDIFVHDRDADEDGVFDETGAGERSTVRVSVATSGAQGDGDCFAPAISTDGRSVTFASDAVNIFSTDTNGQRDIFLHHLQTGVTELISQNMGGTPGDGTSDTPVISDDGRSVAFMSDATNLVDSDTNGVADIFFRDRGPQLPGDLNGDHQVDGVDLDILNQNLGTCACCAADLDGDGDVDQDDRTILYANWTS